MPFMAKYFEIQMVLLEEENLKNLKKSLYFLLFLMSLPILTI